ncbi:hypothetical protein JG536_05360 [Burkholderia ambifaria]|uniref:hypothetical protein n=1 Tax=Burkholderia ambifaria TaxID=152480 RepID=UPI00158F009E|nr:hypothetical protein [Burkholderia ambifaria]QQJ98085.1 hypothetical protein JG536_05360 [Burkholderia ambifaria]
MTCWKRKNPAEAGFFLSCQEARAGQPRRDDRPRGNEPIATLMLRTVQLACRAPDAKLLAPMQRVPLFQTAVHARLLQVETARSIRRESVAITVRASAIGEYTENSIAAGECDD